MTDIFRVMVMVTILLFVAWMGLLAIPQAVGSPGLSDSAIWATLTVWVKFFATLMVIPGIASCYMIFHLRD